MTLVPVPASLVHPGGRVNLRSDTEKGEYHDERAHELRARYVDRFGGPEIPVPVESITEDLLGLAIEETWDMDCSGMLLPAERLIRVSAREARTRDIPPLRRTRFTIAHELGHWIHHANEGRGPSAPAYCRAVDISQDADRALEREANIFAAELLMPEPAVRVAWESYADVDSCAAQFVVSPSAMHWRLYNCELIARPHEEP